MSTVKKILCAVIFASVLCFGVSHVISATAPGKQETTQTQKKTCTYCKGTGNGNTVCSSCKGTGKNGKNRCNTCYGKGFQKCSFCRGTGQRQY